MRKRFSCLLLTTIIAAFSITGCSDDSNSDLSSTASLEETTKNPAFLKPGYTTTSPSVLTAAYTINNETQNLNGDIFQSSSSNENALLVSEEGQLTLQNAAIHKSGNTIGSEDNNSYGQNAALAVVGGSHASLTNTTVTSSSIGANGIVVAGENSSIQATDLAVTTIGDNSNGIDATYNGQIEASNVNITTTGAYSAPVSVSQAHSKIHITGGKFSASHAVSPCLFSAGDLIVDSVTGSSQNNSASIEGGSVTWIDSSFTSAGNYGVLLYETSESNAGSSSFSSENSRLTTTVTDSIFYATNTTAYIDLTNTVIDSSCNLLLNCSGNANGDWGKEGNNGAIVKLSADTQTLQGNIQCDSISQVSVSLKNNSILTGAINTANTGDLVSIELDSSSQWNVTDTSYVHVLRNSDSSCSNIISNGNIIYYDDTNSANSWLDGETIELDNGGSLTPIP
ncbi:hypothetical protein NDGK_01633 [Clostridiales bacterium CHKCI001]|nr:hypothetical protein NDGK_01633 [Clostridiales bacterium CHKCI001]